MNFDDYALNYHNQTKHSYESIRNNPNRLDWDNQPNVYKNYPNTFKKIPIEYSNNVHKLIYLICGITAKKSYPGIEYYLRTNPSAGALYPNELYFQARNIDGIEDGIYHYEVSTNQIVKLYEIDDEGIEPYLHKNKIDGLIFLVSAIYFRSSWKYKNRAFRYCLLDSGHIQGALEFSAYMQDKDYEIVYDFSKIELNKIFGFKNQEFFLSSIIIGKEKNKPIQKLDNCLDFVDGSFYFEQNSIIEDIYKNSVKIEKNINKNNYKFNLNKIKLEDVLLKRRSIREFSKKEISKAEFEIIYKFLNEPICSDCDEEIVVYAVLNRVVGMPLGVFNNTKYLKVGDFKQIAGYLCLEQNLGRDSAVTFFLVSKAKNYQALYQKAGHIGHRLYIISNYLQIGCSGIGAYYDDEVLEFLELDNTYKVLYALAIGN